MRQTRASGLLRNACALVVVALCGFAAVPGEAQTQQSETPEATRYSTQEALVDLLAAARRDGCDGPETDALARVLCSGKLRIGVRDNYPLFAARDGRRPVGYDIDVARTVAEGLGVAAELVPVRPATRISTLAEGGADVVIATMGHNTSRDSQARFIRPHYYRSETIVVAPREMEIAGWDDLFNRTNCTTIGNYANAHIVSQDVRVLLFDNANRLPEALRDGTCRVASHDDSFFASYLADPAFGDRFERKFGFDPVPWGMAVGLQDTERLARALELISQIMHREGLFLQIAESHGIFTAFLEDQQALWSSPACAGPDLSACLIPALDATPPPTAFVDDVERALAWSEEIFGVSPSLPMLMTQPAWQLFKGGVVISLVLVAGALAATLLFAFLLGALSGASFWPARALAWCVVVVVQSSPVLLLLVVVTAIAHAVFDYSSTVAVGAAIVALGLMNGANAGQAIGEAVDSLRAEHDRNSRLTWALFWAAVGRSLSQLMSFLVNAAKGTPVASFTGAPELLAALTDITSFAAGRVTTYTIVLLFYLAVVSGVVYACNRVRDRFDRRHAAAESGAVR
ncbi:MAG: transporter substrate-binding domain-containing protein [Pseudomonadota bacterium]